MNRFLSTTVAATVLAAALAAQTATQVVNSDAAGLAGSYGALTNLFIPQTGGISADGRYVVFSTNQLIDAGDTNSKLDIYVKDMKTGAITRVSVASDGTMGNDALTPPGGATPNSNTAGAAISADGRFVVFHSTFSNLVAGDTNSVLDVFIHDRDADENGTFDETGPGARKTARCSVSAASAEGVGTQATNPSVSDDGRYVCYQSSFTNLVPGDTNGAQDVFLYDRNVNFGSLSDADDPGNIAVFRMSLKEDGTQAGTSAGSAVNASISGNGRHVTFSSSFTDLLTPDANGNTTDILVRDRDANDNGIYDEIGPGAQSLKRVNLREDGTQPLTGQGTSTATAQQAISTNGRYIVFGSAATLVTADTGTIVNIFVRDRDGDADGVFDEGPTGLDNTYMMDLGGNNNAFGPAISPDGRFVVFRSFASNLTAGDLNLASDHFVVDRNVGSLTRVSVNSSSSEQEGVTTFGSATGSNGGLADIANNGTTAFRSTSNNLSVADVVGIQDIFTNGPYPRTQATAAPAIGTMMNVTFKAPFHPGATYIAAVSGGWIPGFFLSNGAILPMNNDALLAFSLATPLPYLVNYTGSLNVLGEAVGVMDIPNDPAIVGFSLVTGFVVVDPGYPTGIGAMSNAFIVTIGPAGP